MILIFIGKYLILHHKIVISGKILQKTCYIWYIVNENDLLRFYDK